MVLLQEQGYLSRVQLQLPTPVMPVQLCPLYCCVQAKAARIRYEHSPFHLQTGASPPCLKPVVRDTPVLVLFGTLLLRALFPLFLTLPAALLSPSLPVQTRSGRSRPTLSGCCMAPCSRPGSSGRLSWPSPRRTTARPPPDQGRSGATRTSP